MCECASTQISCRHCFAETILHVHYLFYWMTIYLYFLSEIILQTLQLLTVIKSSRAVKYYNLRFYLSSIQTTDTIYNLKNFRYKNTSCVCMTRTHILQFIFYTIQIWLYFQFSYAVTVIMRFFLNVSQRWL